MGTIPEMINSIQSKLNKLLTLENASMIMEIDNDLIDAMYEANRIGKKQIIEQVKKMGE